MKYEALPVCGRCWGHGARVSGHYVNTVSPDHLHSITYASDGFDICSCPAGKQHPVVVELIGPEPPLLYWLDIGTDEHGRIKNPRSPAVKALRRPGAEALLE